MAKEASDKALKRASEDENADPKVREMAKKELKSRGDNSSEKPRRKKLIKPPYKSDKNFEELGAHLHNNSNSHN